MLGRAEHASTKVDLRASVAGYPWSLRPGCSGPARIWRAPAARVSGDYRRDSGPCRLSGIRALAGVAARLAAALTVVSTRVGAKLQLLLSGGAVKTDGLRLAAGIGAVAGRHNRRWAQSCVSTGAQGRIGRTRARGHRHTADRGVATGWSALIRRKVSVLLAPVWRRQGRGGLQKPLFSNSAAIRTRLRIVFRCTGAGWPVLASRPADGLKRVLRHRFTQLTGCRCCASPVHPRTPGSAVCAGSFCSW